MVTSAQLAAAFTAARRWIDVEAGFYAGMIPDSDVQKLCQVVLEAAQDAGRQNPQPKESQS